MYLLEVSRHLDRILRRLARKDPIAHKAIEKKTAQILEDPFRFKPLSAPMQGKRRVHVMGSFVLVYSVDEKRNAVILEDYDHHDRIYR
jgi:YafQ family addiction module toxin component